MPSSSPGQWKALVEIPEPIETADGKSARVTMARWVEPTGEVYYKVASWDGKSWVTMECETFMRLAAVARQDYEQFRRSRAT